MILEPMRPFANTLPFDEALRLVLAAPRPTGRKACVALDIADGRVLVSDVLATLDVPPFDRAAMDGYAVVSADTASATTETPVELRVSGRVHSGEQPSVLVAPGTCVEVATGAPMPEGADAVVMVEHTAPSGDTSILTRRAVKAHQHVGPRGGDITATTTSLGSLVVTNGTVIAIADASGDAGDIAVDVVQLDDEHEAISCALDLATGGA